VLVTDPAGPRPGALAFDEFVLDAARATCWRAGVEVALRPKAFALLSHLADNPGRVLSKAELLANVWPGVVVGDDSLSQCVNELRSALGERGQALIKTVARRGYRFDALVTPVAPPGAAAVRHRARWLRWAAACGVAAMLAWAALVGVEALRTPTGIDAHLANRRSLGVMPFADLGQPASPYLAEGITQEILTDLGRMPDTLVVAGGSATLGVRAGGVDVTRVGRDLGVRHVLTGSARRDGDHVEVTAQMARTDNGALLWSERFEYDRPADWNWARDVSQRVAAALDVKLGEAAFESVRRDARNGTAINEWMQGEYLIRRIRSRDDLLEARRHFERAVAADPQSVNALAALAWTHFNELLYRWSSSVPESLAVTRELAGRANALDPNHAMALSILGSARAFSGDYDMAMAYFRRALQHNPNSYTAHRDMAALLYWMVQLDEVPRYAEMAMRLGPMDPDNVAKAYSVLGFTQMIQGHDDEAYRSLRLSVQASPLFPGARTGLIAMAALTGRMDEAHRLVAELMRDRPDMTIAGLSRAGINRTPSFRAAHARYREGMRMAGLPEGQPQVATAAAAGQNKQ